MRRVHLVQLQRLFALSDLIMSGRRAWTSEELAAELPEFYEGAGPLRPANVTRYRMLIRDLSALEDIRPITTIQPNNYRKFWARADVAAELFHDKETNP